MSVRRRLGTRAARLLAGTGEPIFNVLPERILANLSREGSENALVWNMFYPRAQPTLSLRQWLAVSPLWGTPALDEPEDALLPYFWGYSVDGRRMQGLEECLDRLDGSGPQTEVDLFLLGDSTLVLVEAKHLTRAGRCKRYATQRCPEVHPEAVGTGEPCRYWVSPGAQFSAVLDFGPRPAPGGRAPPCARHYQLGRTLLLGRLLAERLSRILHLWLIVPASRWRGLQTEWLDFADRVRDQEQWRRLRVLAWEGISTLPKPGPGRRG